MTETQNKFVGDVNSPNDRRSDACLEISEIPQMVLDELNENFKSVSWDNYGKPFTTDCRTFALKSTELVEEDASGTAIDPTTFEPVLALHVDKLRGFKVRGVFDGAESVDVFDVGHIFALRSRPDTRRVVVAGSGLDVQNEDVEYLRQKYEKALEADPDSDLAERYRLQYEAICAAYEIFVQTRNIAEPIDGECVNVDDVLKALK